MKELVKVGLILSSVALTACSSTDNKQASADAKLTESDFKKIEKLYKKSGYKCELKATTGTRLKKKTCSTKAQREQAKLDAEVIRRDLIKLNGG